MVNRSPLKPPLIPQRNQQYNLSFMPKNVKKQRENESILMSLDLTPALKLASYDYVMAKPDSEANNIFEVTEVLENMCNSIVLKQPYKYSTLKKRITRNPSDFKVDFKAVRRKASVEMGTYKAKQDKKDQIRLRNESEKKEKMD
jgi:hypothetical protein